MQRRGGFIPISEYEQIKPPIFYNETTKEHRERENRDYNATFEPDIEIEAGKKLSRPDEVL